MELSSKFNCIFRVILYNSSRRYSQWPPRFLQPTTRKEELDEPFDDDDPRRYSPIKAAGPDQCPHVLSDPDVSKLVNIIMIGGQKALARQIVMDGFERIKRNRLKLYWSAKNDQERDSIVCDPLVIFREVFANIKPVLWLTSIVRGGIVYQVPIPLNEEQSRFRAFQFIRNALRDKERHRDKKFPADEKLAVDILDAYNNTGVLIKRKQELYRICEANKTYASYRVIKR